MVPKLYFERVAMEFIGDPAIYTYVFNINVANRVISLNVTLGYNIMSTYLNCRLHVYNFKRYNTVTGRDTCHWTEQVLLETGCCYCLNNTSNSN